MAESGGMTSPPEGPPAGRRSVTIPNWLYNALCWVLGMPLIMLLIAAGAYAVHWLDLFFRWL